MPFDVSPYTRPPEAASAVRSSPVLPRQWWRAPLWFVALFTGAKSFADNPILRSRRLNAAGLHVWRLRAAHRMARFRRARLARFVSPDIRAQFDRDGFATLHNVLPAQEFEALRAAILDLDLECRAHQQGDTITSRIAVGPELLRRIPALASLIGSPRWRGLMAYVASTRTQPLYYLQAIAGGVTQGPPDPQLELHSDTFQPSLKAWLFLTDVAEDGRPLTYVAGSHRLTPQRLAWEKQRSVEIGGADRLSQRGSLRVRREELPDLGLPEPTRFTVPANTLVVADTCGFHARGDSDRPTMRIELWAYCRRSPFLPWTGFDLMSLQPIAIRRAQWMGSIVDWLDVRGWKKQHWRRAGAWRETVRP